MRRPSRPLERQSNEYVGYLIMGYLVRRFENGEMGVPPFHLATKVPGLKTQRQERIEVILSLLEKTGLVTSRAYERATYYETTQAGREWYKDTAKKFFEPFLAMYSVQEGP